jgi:OTT_1508-like deaminase
MDEHTTLDGIANNMLPTNSERLDSIKEALSFMDKKFRISERIVEIYNNPNFLPRVHAELILLEHFYANNYQYVDGDKYIGCSKPACYCC